MQMKTKMCYHFLTIGWVKVKSSKPCWVRKGSGQQAWARGKGNWDIYGEQFSNFYQNPKLAYFTSRNKFMLAHMQNQVFTDTMSSSRSVFK